MARTIIFSRSNDVHIPYVTKHLRHTETILIDPLQDIVRGDSIDYRIRGASAQLLYKGRVLSGVTSVWFRKPTMFNELELTTTAAERTYIQTSLNNHAQALPHVLGDAFWISDRGAVHRADNKPYQAIVAAKLGFKIPDTLFASSEALAKEFVSKHGTCVAKTQSNSPPDYKLFFTKRISSKDGLRYAGLRHDPFIFQQYIEPAEELRITVVGDIVFAAKVWGEGIDDPLSKTRDWRAATFNKTFQAKTVTLPEVLTKQCVALVQTMGLQFGAIDLILDTNGEYWFLEINPNGQWAFIEEATGQSIGQTIAAMLERDS